MHCYGYTFPFRIFCERDNLDWPPLRGQTDTVEYVAYPPFLSESTGRRCCPAFEYGRSPALTQRNIATDRKDLGMIGFPTFDRNEDGTTGALLAWSENPDFTTYNRVPCTALQIDILCDHSNVADQYASRLMKVLLRQIRISTLQFWIGYFPGYFEPNLRATFKVDDDYKLLEEPWSHGAFQTPSHRVKPLDGETWSQINMGDSGEATACLDHILDAMHFASSGDKVRCVLSLGVAIEHAKYDIWAFLHRIGTCGRNHYKSAMNDTSKPVRYLTDILQEKSGANIALYDAELPELIDSLWTLRGLAAHGREAQVPQKLAWILEDLPTIAGKFLGLYDFTQDVVSGRFPRP